MLRACVSRAPHVLRQHMLIRAAEMVVGLLPSCG